MDNFDIGFKVRDKKGIEMEEGDILKCFHYIARVRREKIYTYKIVTYWDGRMYGAHLSYVIRDKEVKPAFPLCTQMDDLGRRMDMEIVESASYESFDKRKAKRLTQQP